MNTSSPPMAEMLAAAWFISGNPESKQQKHRRADVRHAA